MNDVDSGTERRIRTRQTIRLVVVLVVVVLLAVWAFSNTDDVDVDWLVTTTSGPLVVVIIASAAIGFLLGLLVAWRRRS